VVVDGKLGYVDHNGVLAIQPRFDYADAFSDGLALVDVDGKVGFIDHKGEWAFSPRAGGAGIFWNGFVTVNEMKDGITGDRWWYMGRDGRLIWQASVMEEPTHEISSVVESASERERKMRESCVAK
jgi:hypothetical protein